MGFGSGIFGVGGFGAEVHSSAALWGQVPARWRNEDAEAGGWFELYYSALASAFGRIDARIRDHVTNLDPSRASGMAVETFSVSAISHEAPTGRAGEYTRLETSSGIGIPGPGWEVVADGNVHPVVAVRLRDDVSVLWVSGYIDIVPTPFNAGIREFPVLRLIAESDGIQLSSDEPESFHRSLLESRRGFFGLKGGVRSIEVTARASGFDAVVRSGYAIGEGWLQSLPSSRTYRVQPDDSDVERLHTDVDPDFMCWDDIPADVLPEYGAGADCDLAPLFEGDEFTSGLSEASDVSTCMFEAEVIAVSALSSAQAAALGLASGWFVTIEVDPSDFDLVVDSSMSAGVAARGIFRIRDGDTVHWFEQFGLSLTPNQVTLVSSTEPDLGDYCVDYVPEGLMSPCWWCKSHIIRIDLTPTEDLIGALGSPVLINEAMQRLKRRIERTLDASVRVGAYVLTTRTTVDVAEPVVTSTSVAGALVTSVPMSLEFDMDLEGVEDLIDLDDRVVIVYE
jgi:hypothetical protein